LGLQFNVHWRTNVAASCFYAAEAVLSGRPLVDHSLAELLAPGAQRLQEALVAESVPADIFWSHVIPLAAEGLGHHDLVKVTLVKTIGTAEANPRVGLFRELFTELLQAFASAAPKLDQGFESSVQAIQRRWNYAGPGLMGGVANWAEPKVLVEEATAVLVYPILGGGGTAYLPYNLACLEAVASDPVTELPEVVRLGWLLSMLNLDLARYSENVPPERLPTVAALAMIPIILSGAVEVSLTAACDEKAIRHAAQAWLLALEDFERRVTAVVEWWETYCAVRPAWATALAALDRLANA
jgi:hypothetical protein